MEILRQAARMFGRKNPQYETLTEVTCNGEATLKVGGVELPVNRSTFTPSEGRLTMDWNLEGLLVAYEIGFLGQRLSAQVRTPPAPRVWGEVAVPLRFGAGREVGEGEL